jgi:type I restriction enzyme M protein
MTNKLNFILNIIQKDQNIHSYHRAFEQLSIFLVLKSTLKSLFLSTFNEYFDKFYCKYSLFPEGESDLSSLNNLLLEKIKSYAKNDPLGYPWDNSCKQNDDTILFLREKNIKITSNRILDYVVREIDQLDDDESLSKDYQQLIDKLSNRTNPSKTDILSNTSLVNAMVQAIKPKPNSRVYDPAMGAGRVFTSFKKVLKDQGDDTHIQAIGYDIDDFAYLICITNLCINGIDIDAIHRSDSIKNYQNTHHRIDYIISEIPFGNVGTDFDLFDCSYKYSYMYECLFFKRYETLFLNHFMQYLAEGGKAAVVVPRAFLYASSSEYVYIRERLIQAFNLHSILYLPKGIYSTHSQALCAVLFFDRSPNYQADSVWFYHFEDESDLKKKTNNSQIDFEGFLDAFDAKKEGENSYLVHKDQINSENKYNLNVIPDKYQHEKIDKVPSIHKIETQIEQLSFCFDAYKKNIRRSLEYKVRAVQKNSLEKICKFKSGSHLNKKDIYEEGVYSVYGGNGIIGYTHEPNREQPCLVIGRVGSKCGNVYKNNGPIWITSNAFSVEAHDDTLVYLPFLYHVFVSLNLNQYARGSAQHSISYERIKSIEIDLPSYEDQVAMTEYLDSIHEKNHLAQQILKESESNLSHFTNNFILNNTLHLV